MTINIIAQNFRYGDDEFFPTCKPA